MDEEREMILRMLKEGKISVEEADALLQELQTEGGEAGRSAEPASGDPSGVPNLRTELRGIFDELVESIPKEVTRELKRAKDVLRPNFWGALHALWDLSEGQAESAAEEPMAAGDRLIVRNAWGDVRIVQGSGPLRMKAIRRVWAPAADDAQRLAQSLDVTPRRSGGEVVVEVPPVEGRRVRVDLELEVPAGVAVAVRLAKGDVRVSDISGPLEVDVLRGDVRAVDLLGAAEFNVTSGDLEIASVKGNVALDVRSGDAALEGIAGSIRGRVLSGDVAIRGCSGATLDVINGDVSIDQASGDVSVDGKSGDLTFQIVQGRAVHGHTLSGDVTVRLAALADDAKVSLETMSGDISLFLPGQARATIDAAVTSGEVDCKVPLLDRAGDRRSLRGVLNGPGAAVQLRTTSGDIDIDTVQ